MNRPQQFDAPWCTGLKLVSVVGSVVLLGASVAILKAPAIPVWVRSVSLVAVLGTLLSCAIYTIRGYELSAHSIRVRRLLWATTIDLKSLRSAEVDPDATRRSIRLFGNGGLFSFSGWFRNSTLGIYRLCATDPRKAVVLRFPNRAWVVSPDRPEEFIRLVRESAGIH